MSEPTAGATDGGARASGLVVSRPDFDAIDLDTVEAELDRHLAHCRATVAQVIADARGRLPTWTTLMQPQAEAHNALNLFWSPVAHLNAVMNSPELREVYRRCLPKLSAYWTELGQNVELHAATLALKEGEGFAVLGAAERREVENDLRDFELGGVTLEPAAKARFGEIAQALSRLSTEFSDAVLDATRAWEKHLDDERALAGLPPSAIAAARERARAKGLDGYLLNLEFPVYDAVMTFAEDRALRREMHEAYVTRASDRGPHAGQFDNSERMAEILRLRAEQAALLGFTSYAERSLARKMADTPEEVIAFLERLAERGVPKAREELRTLRRFAAETLGFDDAEHGANALAAWDIAWASDRLKKREHGLSDEDLRPWFPASRVIPGLFAVLERLFGVEIRAEPDVPVYHPDVSYHAIHDREGRLRGAFYLDPYARENKRGGAWMDVCATRQRIGEVVQLPIAYLVCNLTPPVGDAPALLTHDEVTTLFHEFGHGLHHMLTRIDAAGVSGINGVEWDAVELPSQFLENWCWEREPLDLIAVHVETGAPFPESLLERLRGARTFQSGLRLCRQLELALFDMRLHLDSTPARAADVQGTLDAVRARVAVAPVASFNRFQNAFSHIFAGGYAAGYFSYKWAEVLSADAFARFEESGIFDAAVGRDFLEQVLETGGSRDAMDSFVAFRGRTPSIEALLRHEGLLDAAESAIA